MPNSHSPNQPGSGVKNKKEKEIQKQKDIEAVSYTHLTLPTSDLE